MKNTKAIFLIILGAFLMATGFAFAAESETFKLLSAGNPFGDGRASEITPTNLPDMSLNRSNKGALDGLPGAGTPPAVPAASNATPATGAATTGSAPATTVAPAKPEEPKPTFGEKVQEFFGKYRRDIFRTGISAWMGFALLGGPAGLLIGAVVGFAFFYSAGMSAVGRK